MDVRLAFWSILTVGQASVEERVGIPTSTKTHKAQTRGRRDTKYVTARSAFCLDLPALFNDDDDEGIFYCNAHAATAEGEGGRERAARTHF